MSTKRPFSCSVINIRGVVIVARVKMWFFLVMRQISFLLLIDQTYSLIVVLLFLLLSTVRSFESEMKQILFTRQPLTYGASGSIIKTDNHSTFSINDSKSELTFTSSWSWSCLCIASCIWRASLNWQPLMKKSMFVSTPVSRLLKNFKVKKWKNKRNHPHLRWRIETLRYIFNLRYGIMTSSLRQTSYKQHKSNKKFQALSTEN